MLTPVNDEFDRQMKMRLALTETAGGGGPPVS